MTKVGFVSLGCSKNLVDTEVMLKKLYDAGFEITPDETEAEIVVVNTCGFIESAKQESIDNILDIAWLKEHGKCKHIIATGCLVERYREEVMNELPEVDALVGVGSLCDIAEACNAVMRGEKYTSFRDKNTSTLGGERILTTADHTAYLKIGEGCDNRCTYCAIPLIRGGFRSRTIEDIVKEAKDLEALGVKEVNLIAQDTTRYGLDIYGKYSLADLVKAICDSTNIPWIRLLYCYPDKITDELVKEMRDNPRILKYIDLPLQHVSDHMLAAMNRHGDGKTVRGVVEKLRREIPEIVIRTTFIVGFPGETEEDFCELCEFVKEAKFDHAGVFTYSREEDTPAYDFPDQIDEQVKQDRMDILMRMQMDINEELNKEKIGKIVDVLCEDFDPVAEVHFGRSSADAPEIDGKVYFRSEERIAPGSFVRVKVRDVVEYDLYGNIVTRK